MMGLLDGFAKVVGEIAVAPITLPIKVMEAAEKAIGEALGEDTHHA